MEILATISVTSISIFIFMTLFWIVSIILKKTSIIDVAWGIGFIFVAFIAFFYNGNFYPRSLLVLTLVFLWGIRLAYYIFLRNKGKKEDFRYQRAKEKWGKAFWWKSYLLIFLLQGFVMLIVTFSFQFTLTYTDNSIYLLDIIGFIIWLLGFYFETKGDWELYVFKSNYQNKGRVLKSGLWSLTRHPNYFGESLMWWGVFIISLNINLGIITIISPVAITFSLLKVSGVKMLENMYKDNFEYQEYIKNTPEFFPNLLSLLRKKN